VPKSKKRTEQLNHKRNAKAAAMKEKGTSRYAMKAAYLARVNKFGFQIPDPKPW
jgi:hypothetical protein